MLPARIISSAVFFVLFFLGLFNPWFGWVLPILLTGACLMALFEYMNFGQGPTPLIYKLMGFATALALLADAYFTNLDHALMILGALTVVSLGVGTLRVDARFSDYAGRCLIGTLYATVPMALIMSIWRQAVRSDNGNGQHYLIFLVLGTQAGDIGAYFAGRFLGKHKFAPRLSPKKTWEGFVGGILFTMLVALVAYLFWNNMRNIFGLVEILALACMFSIVGPIGDLTESWLKRNSGIKDSGQTWTGHGGMLDIIDSLLFTTIFYYLYLWALRPGVIGPV